MLQNHPAPESRTLPQHITDEHNGLSYILRGDYYFPDLELPAARGRYTGLHIEMKHGKNKVTEQQDKFLKALRSMGRCAVVCYEAEPAIQVISEYMLLSPGQHLSCDVLPEYPILK